MLLKFAILTKVSLTLRKDCNSVSKICGPNIFVDRSKLYILYVSESMP